MAKISKDYGRGTHDLTTRRSFQLH
ncbi:hypothetical protein [Desulfitobacterium hafniense]|nr:hypothetical protein [Desulfitobacterium hafniense]